MSVRPPSRTGGLAVYVTSHGFGHLNRTSAVLNEVPADVPITIKSHQTLFAHWRERLRRPADLKAFVCDAGAVNPPGDSAATDCPATLALAARVHDEALLRLDDEVERLVRQEPAAVLCDAPALPLLAARRANIPGFLMSNFTWADIYAPYARQGRRRCPRICPATAERLPECDRHVPGRAGDANVVAFADLERGDGRQPGQGPTA